MVEILKKALAIFERFNNLSKKRALSINEVREQEENIKEFEDFYQNFKHFLDNSQTINPNDIKKITEFFPQIIMNLGRVESLIGSLDQMGRDLWQNYIPPDKDAALQYEQRYSHAQCKILRHVQSLEPLYYFKRQEEVINFYKETYILTPLSNGYLVNDGYDGLIIFNADLTIRKTITLYEDFCIERRFYYKNFIADKFIFYISHEEHIVYVDINAGTYKFIHFNDNLEKFYPQRIYYWHDTTLILINDDKNFYSIDIEAGVMTKITSNIIKKKYPDFFDYALEASNYDIIHAYPQNYSFIYRNYDDQEIGLRDIKNNTTISMKFFDPEVHDIQYYEDYFLFIQEKKLEVRKNKIKKIEIPSHPQYDFFDAVFKKENNQLFVIALASYFRLPRTASIIMYEITESISKPTLNTT